MSGMMDNTTTDDYRKAISGNGPQIQRRRKMILPCIYEPVVAPVITCLGCL